MEIRFLDVGQGEAILVLAAGKKAFLVDAGNVPEVLECWMDAMDLDTLEGVVITHADRDHYGALARLAGKVRIKRLFLPLTAGQEASFETLLMDPSLREVPRDTLFLGSRVDLGPDSRLICLWPTPMAHRRRSLSDDNDLSTVLRLEAGEFRALFTGDIEAGAETEMLRMEVDLRCNLLKVAHHGSNTSSSLPFLAAAAPDWAVISCDSSVYGHPHPETLAGLERFLPHPGHILRTDRDGTVAFALDGSGVRPIPVDTPCKD